MMSNTTQIRKEVLPNPSPPKVPWSFLNSPSRNPVCSGSLGSGQLLFDWEVLETLMQMLGVEPNPCHVWYRELTDGGYVSEWLARNWWPRKIKKQQSSQDTVDVQLKLLDTAGKRLRFFCKQTAGQTSQKFPPRQEKMQIRAIHLIDTAYGGEKHRKSAVRAMRLFAGWFQVASGWELMDFWGQSMSPKYVLLWDFNIRTKNRIMMFHGCIRY